MYGFIWFLIGVLTGFLLFCGYSWLMDKLNLIRLGYSGGSFIVRWIYNRFIKTKITKNG